jgi:hypothetical protein
VYEEAIDDRFEFINYYMKVREVVVVGVHSTNGFGDSSDGFLIYSRSKMYSKDTFAIEDCGFDSGMRVSERRLS